MSLVAAVQVVVVSHSSQVSSDENLSQSGEEKREERGVVPVVVAAVRVFGSAAYLPR